ncbi:hypothetical protein GCM10020331_043940 [Ectobacillus funiculus]
MRSLAPGNKPNPLVVLLTPGVHNAAYYDHTFLAQEMGIELVEGRDLVVIDQKVYMKSIEGLRQVDVIYRRIDDEFLDPLAFRPDSVLGVAGLLNAYRAGNVAIANAPGTGVADDKAIYMYVPDMIRYYLKEEPIFKKMSRPMICRNRRKGSMFSLIYPRWWSRNERFQEDTECSSDLRLRSRSSNCSLRKIVQTPHQYIAQPTIQLSCVPAIVGGQAAPRHVDLRAFVFMGNETHVVPGGLTRVALKEGSLVVNSSQGGGTKDTWVLS